MQADGYDPWKKDVSQNLRRSDRKTPSRHRYVQGGRNAPTARRVALGDDPGQRRIANYVPKREKGGKRIWDGSRASLSFSEEVAATMPPPAGCAHGKAGCTGGADSIDHLQPFSERQTELARYKICDGRNHFEACFKKDAEHLYDAPVLVWSCTSCNSSKGGKKGLYENQPRFLEECPGEEECEVPKGGEAVS